jgi:spore coat protein CotH
VGEFVVIYATEDDTDELSVPFKLGSSDSLTLELNDVTVDYLEWDDSDAPEGYSYGSFPEGSWKSRTLEVSQAASNIDAVTFEVDIVESIYVTIDDSDWEELVDNALDKEEYSVSVTYKDVTLDEVSFRTKGNSTLSQVAASNSERFSFKIDVNEYVSGQKLLNLKKLNLNNGYNDPTYMRETISYNVMRNLGLPAPQTAYVNLYINDSLHGLYTMVEQVDSEFLEQNFTDPDGDLYKPDDADDEGLVGHDLVWIDDDFSSYTAIELKTNEDVTGNTAIMSFLNEINNGNDYDAVMDADAMLRYLAASTVMGNLDSYQGTLAHNYYLYEESGQFSIIPWDLNESFGTFSMGCGDVSELYIDEPTQEALSDRPLIEVLLSDDENLDVYHDYITQLIQGDLDPDTLEQTIDEIADLIRSDVQSDPTAFYTSAEFETGLTSDVDQIPGLLSFATDRALSVTNQLNGSVPSSGDGSGYCASTDQFAGIGGPGGPPM